MSPWSGPEPPLTMDDRNLPQAEHVKMGLDEVKYVPRTNERPFLGLLKKDEATGENIMLALKKAANDEERRPFQPAPMTTERPFKGLHDQDKRTELYHLTPKEHKLVKNYNAHHIS